MKQFVNCVLIAGMIAAAAFGQLNKAKLVTTNTQSPGTETSTTINGKQLWIYYHAPSVKGRHIFGGEGALQPDDSVWRAGADYATVLHTDATLGLHGLEVPPGDYSLYIFLDKGQWELIVNKKTGQWGINRDNSTTDKPQDELGRTKMAMSKAEGLIEKLKIDLSDRGGNKGELHIEWENVSASVPFTVK